MNAVIPFDERLAATDLPADLPGQEHNPGRCGCLER